MRRNVEVSGKNLDEVLDRASRYFEVDQETLGYEVLSENRGLLGIFTPRIVRVRVWVEDENQSEKKEDVTNGQKPEIKREKTTIEKSKKPEREISSKRQHREEKTREARTASQEELDQAREEARYVFGQLMNRMDMEIEFHVREIGKRILIEITGKDAGLLIGKHGETMEALESFMKTIFVKKSFHRVGLDVDISGYRKKRKEALVKLAKKYAGKVVQEKRKYKFEPMVARDRRIIHTVLKEHNQIITYSVGEEPDRRVVIDLKDAKKKNGNRTKRYRPRKKPKPE